MIPDAQREAQMIPEFWCVNCEKPLWTVADSGYHSEYGHAIVAWPTPKTLALAASREARPEHPHIRARIGDCIERLVTLTKDTPDIDVVTEEAVRIIRGLESDLLQREREAASREAPPPQWGQEQSEDSGLVAAITAIVRDSDSAFATSGGSSRHWVHDQFLPILNERGYQIMAVSHPEFATTACRYCGARIKALAPHEDCETHTTCAAGPNVDQPHAPAAPPDPTPAAEKEPR